MKNSIIISCLLLAACAACGAHASVPIRWTVETSRVAPAAFDVYRGETLDLSAALCTYGEPLNLQPSTCNLYWQTNGMGSVYWTAPANVSSNVISAIWSPTNDVGAAVYNCFLGVAGSNYRAAFRLRMLAAPGAQPNALEVPRKSIDFATVEVINAPWPNKSDVDEAKGEARNASFAAASALDRIEEHATSTDVHVTPDDKAAWNEGVLFGQIAYTQLNSNTNAFIGVANYVIGAEATNRTHYAAEPDMDFSTVPPSLQLYDIRDGGTNTVYDSRDWTVWYYNYRFGRLYSNLDAALAASAPKAWKDVTASGIDNPASDTVWIDTPNVVLAAGLSWQRNISGGKSFYVLSTNGLYSRGAGSGSGEGSFLDLKDHEGNSVFRYENSASQIKEYNMSEGDVLVCTNGVIDITYYTQTNMTMVGYCSSVLDMNLFLPETSENCEATIMWYVSADAPNRVVVVPKDLPYIQEFFFYAKIEREGYRRVMPSVPMKVQTLVIGDTKYTVTTTVVNGETLLKLVEVH